MCRVATFSSLRNLNPHKPHEKKICRASQVNYFEHLSAICQSPYPKLPFLGNLYELRVKARRHPLSILKRIVFENEKIALKSAVTVDSTGKQPPTVKPLILRTKLRDLDDFNAL